MTVKILHITPLYLCSNAIRMSRDNHHLSDSFMTNGEYVENCPTCGSNEIEIIYDINYGTYFKCQKCNEIINNHIGKKDLELIQRVGNKLKHKSVLEQIVIFYEIDGISRACLQELARTRTSRMVVQSTRYVLHKKLKNEEPFVWKLSENQFHIEYERAQKYIVLTGNKEVDKYAVIQLDLLRENINKNISNDIVKYNLVENFKTKLQWQIDMRNFQNFLELRTSKDALWEIRKLALKLFEVLPDDYKELCKEYVKQQ